ncbi:MAG: M48 family metalloprotease [Geminicoccaceae bacterium]|nr:M48 family metalloprotease [Geminicoccaceae bacterium]MCS7268572.1 M48 family metalloprotease [Geminicoccaceae bacterium]MCX7629021.1 M48 family metalloprotease [Geminicoccaceae bacterium]MDW8123855.1 M48 family metalloprotease [Geminicoccaceae bacterium]MDW8341167.1 M48 family metalloprotease [Geminicoccaceae bacterium]
MRTGIVPLAFCACLLATGCTPVRNPATGELQYTTMTPQDELRIGREQHPRVLAEFGGEAKEPRARAYVQEIGEKVKAVSELADQRFTFTLLDSDLVNAFALPGGYVYVTRGLLALADDEAELAGVLGHEIGHVTARHTAQRYDRAMLGQLGAIAATIAGGILAGEAGAQLGQALGGTLATAYVQGFSREQELEADRLGVRYLARAGYDPMAMASFLDALEAESRLKAKLEGRKDEIPDWLRSHPRTRERIREAAAAAAGRQAGLRNRDRFLAAIDGLVFGDSPAQGFVRGTRFLHPELDFRFEAPPGFTLINRPQAVIGRASGGRFLQFDLATAERTSDPLRYLQEEWIARQRLERLRRIATEDGREGALGLGRVNFRNQPAAAVFAAVESGRPRQFYRFVLLRTGGLSSSDLLDYEATVRSLRRLDARERAEARPYRIRIHQVQPGETEASLIARMAIPDAAEWFAVLNDTARRPIRPGEKVKLVVRE